MKEVYDSLGKFPRSTGIVLTGAENSIHPGMNMDNCPHVRKYAIDEFMLDCINRYSCFRIKIWRHTHQGIALLKIKSFERH